MIGWAVQRSDGTIVVEIGPAVTERLIWTIALGWPTRGEVRREKENGGRAFRCQIIEIEASANSHTVGLIMSPDDKNQANPPDRTLQELAEK